MEINFHHSLIFFPCFQLHSAMSTACLQECAFHYSQSSKMDQIYTVKTSCDYKQLALVGFTVPTVCTNFLPTVCISSNNFLLVLGCHTELTSIQTGKKLIFTCQIKTIMPLFAFQHRGWIKKNYAFLCKVGTTAITERHDTASCLDEVVLKDHSNVSSFV